MPRVLWLRRVWLVLLYAAWVGAPETGDPGDETQQPEEDECGCGEDELPECCMAVTAACEACKDCCSEDRWCVSRDYGLTDRLCIADGVARQIKRVGTQGDKSTVLVLVLVLVSSVLFLGVVAWYCLCKRKNGSGHLSSKQDEAPNAAATGLSVGGENQAGHQEQHHSEDGEQQQHSEDRP
eukprot:COSAG02_NODE_1447_length_12575_cov_8.479400_2_plen_181_part_00